MIIGTSFGLVTARPCRPCFPDAVATMSACPAPSAVTNPEGDTEAMFGAEDVQATGPVAIGAPRLSTPVTIAVTVSPTTSESCRNVTTTDASVGVVGVGTVGFELRSVAPEQPANSATAPSTANRRATRTIGAFNGAHNPLRERVDERVTRPIIPLSRSRTTMSRS